MTEQADGTAILRGVADTVGLIMDAKHDELDSPDSMTLNLRGDEPAEALGHAYHLRDCLRDEGFEAEAEYIGLADEQPDWSSQPRHEIRLSWK